MIDILISKNKSILLLIIFSLISILLLVFNSIVANFSNSIKSALFYVVYPFQYGFLWLNSQIYTLSKNVENFSKNIKKIEEYEKYIHFLEQRQIVLEGKLNYYKQLVEGITQYTLSDTYTTYKVLFSSIISSSIDNNNTYIYIDKGSINGVLKELPVVAFYNGSMVLIGKVQEVFPTFSKVLLIVDKNIRIGVYFENSGEIGIMEGSGSLYIPCPVKYISVNAKINIGELVKTSGVSDIYPPYILVGEVVGEKIGKFELMKTVYVKPLIDLKNLRYVFVIYSPEVLQKLNIKKQIKERGE